MNMNNQHLLDSVPVSLSTRLTMDMEVQHVVTVVDSVLDKLNRIEWKILEYSFVLEKTVLENQRKMLDTAGDAKDGR